MLKIVERNLFFKVINLYRTFKNYICNNNNLVVFYKLNLTEMTNNNDEIDLIELFKKIHVFIKKNKWVLILVFILGSAIGYYQSSKKAKKSKDIYRSQFIVDSPFINNNEIYMIGRNLSYNLDSNKTSSELLNSIDEIECLKQVNVEGEEPEVNMVFKTTQSLDVNKLIDFVKEEIKLNKNFDKNYKLEVQHQNELLELLNKELSEVKEEKDSKQFLAYIELLERKQNLEKKMALIENPIQCYPIEPLNLLEPAAKLSVFIMLGYGLILSFLSVMIILLLRFIKLVLA